MIILIKLLHGICNYKVTSLMKLYDFLYIKKYFFFVPNNETKISKIFVAVKLFFQ